jgi:mannose-6-phosphate isomerase
VNNLIPFKLIPEYRDYVWGGQRLRPGCRTAEAWIVYEANVIAEGPWAGLTLAQVMEQEGDALLGDWARRHGVRRFPLLIKLLDCADWLSVQVHPDDAQAQRLEGDASSGKTEAWHVLEAADGAELIAGVRPGVGQQALLQALQQGQVLDVVQRESVQAGDTIYVPAGTIHALGPGLLVYEIQQVSDLTYRIYDWDRPTSNGRVLHLEKAKQVVKVEAGNFHHSLPMLGDGQRSVLVLSMQFRLELLSLHDQAMMLAAGRTSFQTLTVTEGTVQLLCDGQSIQLERLDTIVIPAVAPDCVLEPLVKSRVLFATLPSSDETLTALSGRLI